MYNGRLCGVCGVCGLCGVCVCGVCVRRRARLRFALRRWRPVRSGNITLELSICGWWWWFGVCLSVSVVVARSSLVVVLFDVRSSDNTMRE